MITTVTRIGSPARLNSLQGHEPPSPSTDGLRPVGQAQRFRKGLKSRPPPHAQPQRAALPSLSRPAKHGLMLIRAGLGLPSEPASGNLASMPKKLAKHPVDIAGEPGAPILERSVPCQVFATNRIDIRHPWHHFDSPHRTSPRGGRRLRRRSARLVHGTRHHLHAVETLGRRWSALGLWSFRTRAAIAPQTR